MSTFLEMLQRRNWVVLDTETTGLHYAEVIQIGVVDPDGNVLLDTLCRPLKPIPYDATRIHGITTEIANTGQSWPDVNAQLARILDGKDLIIYNASYDLEQLQNSDALHGLTSNWYQALNGIHCAMLWYAEYWGDWDDYHGNNRWQRLTNAIHQQGLRENAAHSALGDALMTRDLILHVAQVISQNDAAESPHGGNAA